MNKVASSFQSLQIPDMFEMPFPFIFSDSRQSVPSHPQWDEIIFEEHYYIKSQVVLGFTPNYRMNFMKMQS